jgi:hypothetical protein
LSKLRDNLGDGYFALVRTEQEILLYDAMAEAVDKWLIENAEEFGYQYKKGVI